MSGIKYVISRKEVKTDSNRISRSKNNQIIKNIINGNIDPEEVNFVSHKTSVEIWDYE